MNNKEGVNIKEYLPFAQKFETPGDLISTLLPWFFNIAFITLFFFLLWGGIQYLFSQGNPKRTEEAKRRLSYAIIGFVVSICAFLIVQVVEKFTGIPIFGK